MATVVTKSIGSGGGRDYSTLQSWEDAKPASLTASDQIWRGEAYSTTEFATTLVVSGSTTDATRYCELTVAAGHSFADHADKLTNALRYNASSGVGLRTTTAWGATLTASENYFRLSRMQVQNASTNGTAVAGTGTNVTIDQCIVECNGGRAVDLNTGAVLTNSLFVGRKSGADSIASLWNATVANCVFAAPSGRAPTHAIRRNYWSSFSMTNCAVFGASTLFTGSSGATFSACYTDNASPPSGFTQVAYDTSTGSGFESITDGSHDYRIKSTSALKDAGTSSGAPSVDIVGSTRPQGGAYDVGAWEYAAGGGSTITATTSLSAAIQLAQQISSGASLAVQSSPAVTSTVTAAVQAARTAQAQLDLVAQQARSDLAAVQAAVQAAGAQTTSLQAAVQLARAASLSLDLAVQAQRAATADISLQVQAASQQSASVDLYVQSGSTASTSLALAVLSQALASAGVDLAVQLPGLATTGASTAVQVARSAAAVLDLALQRLRTAGASVSLQVQAGTSALAQLDVAVQQAQATTAAVQMAVAQAMSASASLAAAVQVQRLVTSAVDAAVAWRAAASLGLSLYVDDGSVLRPGLRHLWAIAAQRDLWAKPALRDLWARPERGRS